MSIDMVAVESDDPGGTWDPYADRSRDLLERSLRELAIAVGRLATYCDKTEHNEPWDAGGVRQSGLVFRDLAQNLAATAGISLRESYAQRLRELEGGHLWGGSRSPAAWECVEKAGSWAELQQAQAEHDRYYHPDIFGLSKQDQLRHYTLHMAKITGHLAEVCAEPIRWTQFAATRLPDLALFGVKIASVAGEHLEGDLPSSF